MKGRGRHVGASRQHIQKEHTCAERFVLPSQGSRVDEKQSESRQLRTGRRVSLFPLCGQSHTLRVLTIPLLYVTCAPEPDIFICFACLPLFSSDEWFGLPDSADISTDVQTASSSTNTCSLPKTRRLSNTLLGDRDMDALQTVSH